MTKYLWLTILLLPAGCCGPPGTLTYETELCYMLRGEWENFHSVTADRSTVDIKDTAGRKLKTYYINRWPNGNVDVEVYDRRIK